MEWISTDPFPASLLLLRSHCIIVPEITARTVPENAGVLFPEVTALLVPVYNTVMTKLKMKLSGDQ